ncbi:hypothetical protein RRG08_030409 [Elysia crispata]|uniref:Uncharacterized protein n=1 Tax=Elysia crispata TaxID=231223 RepID=A0AAE0YGM0_9GAST|nr:hypothetical protein RRG08_030409 [Elysia crispata]
MRGDARWSTSGDSLDKSISSVVTVAIWTFKSLLRHYIGVAESRAYKQGQAASRGLGNAVSSWQTKERHRCVKDALSTSALSLTVFEPENLVA